MAINPTLATITTAPSGASLLGATVLTTTITTSNFPFESLFTLAFEVDSYIGSDGLTSTFTARQFKNLLAADIFAATYTATTDVVQTGTVSTNFFGDTITSTASDFEVVFSSSASSDNWSQADRAKWAGGGLAGIIIGGLVALLIIVGGIVLCLRRRKRQKPSNVEQSAVDTGHSFPSPQIVTMPKPSAGTEQLELADTALPPGGIDNAREIREKEVPTTAPIELPATDGNNTVRNTRSWN